MFDTIARHADADVVPAGTKIKWDLNDSPPWHIVLDANAGSSAIAGPAPHADLTLRSRFADWTDVSAGRADPRALMLRGRLRPRGSLRTLLALPRVFR